MGTTVDVVRRFDGEDDQQAIDRVYSEVASLWPDDGWTTAVHEFLLWFHDGWKRLHLDWGPEVMLWSRGVQFELQEGDVTVRPARDGTDWELLWACCEGLRRRFGTATAINYGDIIVVDPLDELKDLGRWWHRLSAIEPWEPGMPGAPAGSTPR